jgi:hypothetical protein
MTNKKIDLGEYVIKIAYDKSTGKLDVLVYDELGDIIESIHVITDEDEDNDVPLDYNLN